MENQDLKMSLERTSKFLRKIIESEDGRQLVRKQVLTFIIWTTLEESPDMAVLYTIRDKAIQDRINNILFKADEQDGDIQELTISEYIDIYIHFALFVKSTAEEMIKDKVVKGIKFNNEGSIEDIVNSILNEIDKDEE